MADGTSKSIAFVERPRGKVTEAPDDVVTADMVEEVGGYLGCLSLISAAGIGAM